MYSSLAVCKSVNLVPSCFFVFLFFVFVCVTCIYQAKIGLGKCYEHAKNIYLVGSMSRCSMSSYESGNGPTEPKPPYIYIVNEDLLRSFSGLVLVVRWITLSTESLCNG